MPIGKMPQRLIRVFGVAGMTSRILIFIGCDISNIGSWICDGLLDLILKSFVLEFMESCDTINYRSIDRRCSAVQYISGIHALNIPCSLLTCGDWHCSALKWQNITFMDTEKTFFKDYGIELQKRIPQHSETYAVANHIRALLDLLEIGNFSTAQGMNKDFICNDDYNDEIFEKVASMKMLPNWSEIDRFMTREYYQKWVNFKKGLKV